MEVINLSNILEYIMYALGMIDIIRYYRYCIAVFSHLLFTKFFWKEGRGICDCKINVV